MKVRVSKNSFLMAVGGGLAIVAMAKIGLLLVIENRFVVVKMESAWLKMGPMQEGVLKMSLCGSKGTKNGSVGSQNRLV